MIYFAYPHSYIDPPIGDCYHTLVEEGGTGWLKTHRTPSCQDVAKIASIAHLLYPVPSLIVPLTEEGVLSCGMATSALGLNKGIDLRSALLCTDRYLQRKALDELGVNPKWGLVGEDVGPKAVLKAPASTLSRGIHFISPSDNIHVMADKMVRRSFYEMARLRRAGGACIPIVEEYIEGSHYEANGIVSGLGSIIFFNILEQVWHGDRIMEYKICTEPMLKEKADIMRLLSHLNINSCGFCIEFTISPFTVIEVHCRLGEDGGNYNELLSPKQPMIQTMYEILA